MMAQQMRGKLVPQAGHLPEADPGLPKAVDGEHLLSRLRFIEYRITVVGRLFIMGFFVPVYELTSKFL